MILPAATADALDDFAPAPDAVRWAAPGFGGGSAPAPALRPPTAAEIEAIRAAAQAEGRAAGYAAGVQSGEAEAARRVAQLQALLDGFAKPLSRLDDEVGDALSDLASRMARVLVGRAYAADPTLLADLAREAMDAVGSAGREVELRLSSDDFTLLSPHLTGLPSVRVSVDAALSRGELKMQSEAVRIDGTVDARLRAVLQAAVDREAAAASAIDDDAGDAGDAALDPFA